MASNLLDWQAEQARLHEGLEALVLSELNTGWKLRLQDKFYRVMASSADLMGSNLAIMVHRSDLKFRMVRYSRKATGFGVELVTVPKKAAKTSITYKQWLVKAGVDSDFAETMYVSGEGKHVLLGVELPAEAFEDADMKVRFSALVMMSTRVLFKANKQARKMALLPHLGQKMLMHDLPKANERPACLTLMGWACCYVDFDTWRAFYESIDDRCGQLVFRLPCSSREQMLSLLVSTDWLEKPERLEFYLKWNAFASQLLTYGGMFYVVTIMNTVFLGLMDGQIVGVAPVAEPKGCVLRKNTCMRLSYGKFFYANEVAFTGEPCEVVDYTFNPPTGEDLTFFERLGFPAAPDGVFRQLERYR